MHFVNADLIASGLSPLRPESAAIAAGKLFSCGAGSHGPFRREFRVREHLERPRVCFAPQEWKAAGYRVEIVYLKISSPHFALRRIAARVRQGGHNVPREDVFEAVRAELDKTLWEFIARWPTRGSSV